MIDHDIPPGNAIEAAITASMASSCQKSQRGCAIYTMVNGAPFVLGHGFNSQPEPYKCNGQCLEHCNKLCVHAEVRAIQNVCNDSIWSPRDACMVHVKTVDGELAVSGPPSCWQCSRHILDEHMAGVWLYHATGWVYYRSIDFHRLTLEYCGLTGASEG